MKSVMASIRPKWCMRIWNGTKTCEVRKTKPKLETPFRCYVYASKGKDRLIEVMKDGAVNYGEVYHGKPIFIKTAEEGGYSLNRQMVIGYFTCDKVVEVTPSTLNEIIESGELEGFYTGMQIDDFLKYMGEKCYLWHISNFVGYFKAKPLSDFASWGAEEGHYMKVPPQSWCYVEDFEHDE